MKIYKAGGTGTSDPTFSTNEVLLPAFTPILINVSDDWVPAQATTLLAADALVVAPGMAMSKGVFESLAHGFVVGEEYVTDPNVLGGIILRSALAVGEPYQKLFTVANINELLIDVQPLIDASGAIVVSEEFEGFTGIETIITIAAAIPSNVVVHVVRSGDEIREGALNDYTISGQVVTLTAPLNPGEWVKIYWLETYSKIFRQEFEGLILGNSILTPTVNLGILPINEDHIFLWRQGVFLREGAGNDYTLAGNIITVTAPFVPNDSFILLFYT